MTDVQRIAVLGAGTMGHGIAQVAACAGFDVRLYDPSADALGNAERRIAASLAQTVGKGKLTQIDADAARARIVTTRDLGAATRDCDLMIEAAPEKLAIKAQLFAEVARLAPPHAILASNTSSLRITQLADASSVPERVVGMHFFNPPQVLRLLEIVRTQAVDDTVLDTVRAVGARLQREMIVVRDSPGFATSRLGVALGLEAIRMLEEGVASAEDIDQAMQVGYRHPMGPLRLTDLVGLDVRLAIAEYLQRELDAHRFAPPELLRRMVKDGKLGQKSGEGFYRWST